MKHFAVFLILLASPVCAQSQRLTGAEISALLPTIVATTDTTRQVFLADGVTQYYDNGQRTIGWWEVRANQYCSAWGSSPSSPWSCYKVHVDGEILTWVSDAGHHIENHIETREAK